MQALRHRNFPRNFVRILRQTARLCNSKFEIVLTFDVNVNKGRNFLAELFVLYKAGFVLEPVLVEFDEYAGICIFIKK